MARPTTLADRHDPCRRVVRPSPRSRTCRARSSRTERRRCRRACKTIHRSARTRRTHRQWSVRPSPRVAARRFASPCAGCFSRMSSPSRPRRSVGFTRTADADRGRTCTSARYHMGMVRTDRARVRCGSSATETQARRMDHCGRHFAHASGAGASDHRRHASTSCNGEPTDARSSAIILVKRSSTARRSGHEPADDRAVASRTSCAAPPRFRRAACRLAAS